MRSWHFLVFGGVVIYLIVSSGLLKSGEPKMVSTLDFVKQTIASNRVVVFSKTYCPYCKKAKAALSSVGLPADKLTVVELDTRDDGQAIQDALLELTGGRSVPRVFIDGEFFGGGDDTDAAARNGKLAELFKSKGIM